MHRSGHPGYDDDSQYPDCDEDGHRIPWCRDIDRHTEAHEFCGHHQISWCRLCDRGGCPACVDDPRCPDCGCALMEEYHDWDCGYAGDNDD